jgi:hypothetical protein
MWVHISLWDDSLDILIFFKVFSETKLEAKPFHPYYMSDGVFNK